jgi:hypothetical protein
MLPPCCLLSLIRHHFLRLPQRRDRAAKTKQSAVLQDGLPRSTLQPWKKENITSARGV